MNELLSKVCSCRVGLNAEIAQVVENGAKRVLLVGASGSGKSRLAEAILGCLSKSFERVTQLDGYGVSERESVKVVKEKMSAEFVLIEELGDFSMTMTARDRRLTFCLAHLLESCKSSFVVATAREESAVDPALLNQFEHKFLLVPPDLNGRMALFRSLEDDVDGGLVRQYRACKDEQEKGALLKHYSGLQPSELIVASEYTPEMYFDRVAGVDSLLERIKFLVLKPLTDPAVFTEIGARPPRGVLLTGLPGCGKTLIARSIGRASKSSFFDIAGVEIIAKEVGESEKRLHSVFERARAAAPSIVLFDDIDAIAPKRTFGTTLSEAGDRLLTTLLVEMDGLRGKDDGVVVIATTSRLSSIDPALTRPGRFDHIIEIPLPDSSAREQIFDLYSKDVPIQDHAATRKMVVDATYGLTGANIEGIIREAAMITIRENTDSPSITPDAFKRAIANVKPPTSLPQISLGAKTATKPKRKFNF